MICCVENCDSKPKKLTKGMCEKHYSRLRRTGSTDKSLPPDMKEGSLHKSSNFGDFVVLSYINSKKVKVRFVDTGYQLVTTSNSIRKGWVKDKMLPSVFGVGYVGDGEYRPVTGKIHSPSYRRWICMLRRCYSNSNSRHVADAYKNVSVCDEWHNYQNFAKWFDENYIDGFDLDKDILSVGSKIYSPETCLFVSSEENSLEVNGKRFTQYCISNGDQRILFRNISKVAKEIGVCSGALCRLVNGKRKTCGGWRLEFKKEV